MMILLNALNDPHQSGVGMISFHANTEPLPAPLYDMEGNHQKCLFFTQISL